jgi:hypothetical protein
VAGGSDVTVVWATRAAEEANVEEQRGESEAEGGCEAS